jgi:ATP-dependent RNA helicase DeaD
MGEEDQTIIFANTKRMVDLMVQRLKKHRFEADGLHGDLNQNQRERILEKFRSGNLSIIVATDVASRGIDVDGVTCVINYDVPDDVDSYVHRIGRTGRIGRKGQSWTLVSRDDIPQMNKIQATHSLDIVASEAPELPDGISRDPINKQQDNSEVSDVFGMVPIQISTDSLSKLKISEWLIQNIRCDPLAIGTITVSQGSSMIEVHNRSVEHALKAFNTKTIHGQQLKAAVIE